MISFGKYLENQWNKPDLVRRFRTKPIVTKLILSSNKSTIESITEQKIIYSNSTKRKREPRGKWKKKVLTDNAC